MPQLMVSAAAEFALGVHLKYEAVDLAHVRNRAPEVKLSRWPNQMPVLMYRRLPTQGWTLHRASGGRAVSLKPKTVFVV